MGVTNAFRYTKLITDPGFGLTHCDLYLNAAGDVVAFQTGSEAVGLYYSIPVGSVLFDVSGVYNGQNFSFNVPWSGMSTCPSARVTATFLA